MVFYTYGPKLAILAWTDDELSRGQAGGWRTRTDTHTQTDEGNDNTRKPKLASGKNDIWPMCLQYIGWDSQKSVLLRFELVLSSVPCLRLVILGQLRNYAGPV